MSDEQLEPLLGQLPDPVRLRILALTADVLPDLVRLPPALRRVAAFAPGRRARLGATAIATALETDDDLRERVAKQVTVKGARVESRIAAPTEGGVADAGERAALAVDRERDGHGLRTAELIGLSRGEFGGDAVGAEGGGGYRGGAEAANERAPRNGRSQFRRQPDLSGWFTGRTHAAS